MVDYPIPSKISVRGSCTRWRQAGQGWEGVQFRVACNDNQEITRCLLLKIPMIPIS